MSLTLQDIVGNIFYLKERDALDEARRNVTFRQKVNNVFGTSESAPSASVMAKNYLSQASDEPPDLSVSTRRNLTDDSTTTDNTRRTIEDRNLTDNSTTTDNTRRTVENRTIPKKTTTQTPTPTTSATPTPTTSATPTPTTSATPNTNEQSNGNAIVTAANKYMGTPYVWGGESMEEGGMDCSGFVYNALKDAGYNVGRTTAQGYRKGTVISRENLQAGDLVFFGKGSEATHIGIYLGDGKMIHSSGGSKNTKSNPGKGVSITNVDYRSDFLEGRRY